MQGGELRTTRRQLLTAIGMVGGTAALYQAMTTMGHAAETQYKGPPDLSGARAGSTVLVLGAVAYKRSRLVVFLNFWFTALVTWNTPTQTASATVSIETCGRPEKRHPGIVRRGAFAGTACHAAHLAATVVVKSAGEMSTPKRSHQMITL